MQWCRCVAIVWVLYPSLKIKICGSIFLSFGRYVFFFCRCCCLSLSLTLHLLRSAFTVVYIRPACCCLHVCLTAKHIPTHAHFFVAHSHIEAGEKKKPTQVHSHIHAHWHRIDRVSVRVCFIGFIENGFTSASTKLAGWSGFNPMHTYLIPIEMKRKKCLCTLFSRFLSFSLSCLGEIQKFHSFNLVIYVCCGIL